jgi:hypothetical protein
MITTAGNRVTVDTNTLQAVVENGILVSLTRKTDGRVLLHAGTTGIAPLELVYGGQERVPLGTEVGDRITTLPVNDRRAEVRIESWNGDAVIAVYEDPATGELVIEPSAYASRPGLRACRWPLRGIDRTLKLVAPLWQGVRLSLGDPIIRNQHFPWPFEWQAGLAILQADQGGGFWVHCQDAHYRFKALHVGSAEQADTLYFDTESYGPLDLSLGTGSLAWRINVFEGDWQTPAAQYRDWLANTYHPERTPRPDWIKDLRFAISWCPCDPAILDALAKRLSPGTVLLHIPGWRTDSYDQNYPTFVASAQGRAFVEKAQQMGFRAMPHFNSIDMDPTHPAYTYLRDFQYREVESKRLQGWTWANHQVKPLQESNAARLRHQDKNTMVKIHPGLSMWRSILTENVRKAVLDLGLDVAFLDVTLCTWNLHNCLVEGLTPTEGMKLLIAEVASIKDRLVVGGEGRNEITMQDTGLSQVHLFRSSGRSIDGLERTAGSPVNEFLFGQWSRSFGYSSLSGKTEDEQMRMHSHVSLGAVPTVTIHSADEVKQPNLAVEEMLHLAAGR